MKHFVRHYVEMVLVMFAGMALLWTPADLVVDTDSTGAMLATMAFTMTVPMIPWMRWRGHRWPVEHVAMFGGMLAVMLARRAEYSHREVAA